jgi:signal transduction histidine kinase
LGLAIVKKIIEGWDGEISLKSTIAGGTTIDFRFPVGKKSLSR